MQAGLYLPLVPADERDQLEYGDLVRARDVRRLAVLHRRAAEVTPKLLRAGWEVWYTQAGLVAEHAAVTTREEAEGWRQRLGIPPGWVEVEGPRAPTAG